MSEFLITAERGKSGNVAIIVVDKELDSKAVIASLKKKDFSPLTPNPETALAEKKK